YFVKRKCRAQRRCHTLLRLEVDLRAATVRAARYSLRHGHQLDDVAVVVFVIEAATAIPIVELAILKTPRPASEGEPGILHPLQDRVEFGVADVKRIVL